MKKGYRRLGLIGGRDAGLEIQSFGTKKEVVRGPLIMNGDIVVGFVEKRTKDQSSRVVDMSDEDLD